MKSIISVCMVVSAIVCLSANAQVQPQTTSRLGALSVFDQFVGAGIWDYGNCLGEDFNLPPGAEYRTYMLTKSEVVLDGLKFNQAIYHYESAKCPSGKGYAVIRSPAGDARNCLIDSYNHFCVGAPRKTVLKTGVWDFGDCAGGDRNFCPGLGYNFQNGATVVYDTPQCASGKARCTVDSRGFGNSTCEIARYIHTCE